MKIHESAENYLETILMLQKRIGQVRSIDIANELGFSKPSVSVAVKQFRENGYITVDSNGFIELSVLGMSIAERVLERHNIISQALVELGVSEAIAREDACRIEHDVSEETFACIKRYVVNIEKQKGGKA